MSYTRPGEDEILTTAEVAEMFKVPIDTVYKWTAEGTGPPFYKIGKHNRWLKSEVMEWFLSHQDEVSSGR